MKVIRAEALGMCFGVRDALRAIEREKNPKQVTIHGQLVHNPVVLRRIDERGFRQQDEHQRDELPETTDVMITAHGISQSARDRLESAGKRLIDTTCPLVVRVHEAARKLADEGRHLLVLGQPGHVEVRGIVEDLQDYEIVPDAGAVRAYVQPSLGVVCQSTMPPTQVRDIWAQIQLYNPLADIRFVDTVCDPTRQRQAAMRKLLGQVDAVVVVGGHNSNNTRQLVRMCHEQQVPAMHVEGPGELIADWFADCRVVGLTAGTSTLDETIDAVERTLREIPPGRGFAPPTSQSTNTLSLPILSQNHQLGQLDSSR
jgi:4-hydroxy-3-methylbut-2-enyl diphosphate reductase